MALFAAGWPVKLDDWQDRLENHFALLGKEREETGWPTFALEHDLSETELHLLESEIRAEILLRPPRENHWLAWVIYASEIGYRFTGNEYWQTFEQETPGWTQQGDRSWIRRAFRKFKEKFHGFEPLGPWADHFSIICWPITHSILAKDLQKQLARILYDLRHTFDPSILASAEALGTLIASRSGHTSSRFVSFVEQPLLAGQISAALLLGRTSEGSRLLSPSTLKRISVDLDAERTSREWLHDARTRAERIGCHGLSRFSRKGGETTQDRSTDRIAFRQSLEPHCQLRTRPDGAWELFMEIPSFSAVAGDDRDIESFLENQRCRVAGSSGRPLARGALLSRHVVRMTHLPKPGPILSFESAPPPELHEIAESECVWTAAPFCLFRILSDGTGVALKSNIVRAKRQYVILAPTVQHDDVVVQPTMTSVEGVSAAFIDMPANISESARALLVNLGLAVGQNLDVCPAAVPAASWDGEGHVEWVSSDAPCIQVSADHDVQALELRLQDTVEDTLTLSLHGEPVLVDLSPLSVGSHQLEFVLPDTQEPIGLLEITIRDPHPWRSALNDRSAVLVLVDPRRPSLEQLWSNQAQIRVFGPKEWSLHPRIVLRSSRQRQPIYSKALPLLEIPVTASRWSEIFSEHVLEDLEALNAVELANVCDVEFDAGELGRHTLCCDRELAPLRWIVRASTQQRTVMLVDDTGLQEAEIARYAFAAPDTPTAIAYPLVTESGFKYEVGGLFEATNPKASTSVIVPPAKDIRRLEELTIHPIIRHVDRSFQSECEILRMMQRWANARVHSGLQTTIRVREVRRALELQLFTALCGEDWGSAERIFLNSNRSLSALSRLADQLSSDPDEAHAGSLLVRNAPHWSRAHAEDRIEPFIKVCLPTFGVPALKPVPGVSTSGSKSAKNSHDLYEFILRLCSNGEAIASWIDTGFDEFLMHVRAKPVLTRAARLLVLAVDHNSEHARGSGEMHPGWDWI